jgi:ribosome-binding ATPase YchF (GTP1/OBG family)
VKASLIGENLSGRETVFRALTGSTPSTVQGDTRLGEALVQDERLDNLSSIYQPRKHTPARLELTLPKPLGVGRETVKSSLEKVRDSDCLLLVLRNFPSDKAPDPKAEASFFLSELMVADYLTVTKRLERLSEEKKRGKPNDPMEVESLTEALELLESEKPLRDAPKIAKSPKLRGYGLLSAKPILILLNDPDDFNEQNNPDNPDEPGNSDNSGNSDDAPNKPGPLQDLGQNIPVLRLRGRLEEEFSRLTSEEASEFMADYGLTELAAARVIRTLYRLNDLVSFFTVGDDECRAWTVNRGDTALVAAGRIHSDIQKGFIRAEVVSYEDFKASGSMAEAKKKGLVRLEGKNYIINDGDIVLFRFNV